jgi:hypothetical protein
VTLPLVSFGGSSTVISLIAIGLLLNISRQPAAAVEVDDEIDDDDPRAPEPSYREPIPRTRLPIAERRRPVPVQVAPIRVRTLGRRSRSTRRA